MSQPLFVVTLRGRTATGHRTATRHRLTVWTRLITERHNVWSSAVEHIRIEVHGVSTVPVKVEIRMNRHSKFLLGFIIFNMEHMFVKCKCVQLNYIVWLNMIESWE